MSGSTTKEAMARQLWLHYFNHVLYRRGIITQAEYRKLASKIYRKME